MNSKQQEKEELLKELLRIRNRTDRETRRRIGLLFTKLEIRAIEEIKTITK
jgi:hypothetical protein